MAFGLWSSGDQDVQPQLLPHRYLRQQRSKGWWHRQMGISRYNSELGTGIRVGVIDTGIGPHLDLEHANDVGAFIDGGFDPSEGLMLTRMEPT